MSACEGVFKMLYSTRFVRRGWWMKLLAVSENQKLTAKR